MSKLMKDMLFKPSSRASDKWEVTNTVSRKLIESEQTAREKKTERLRKMRLEAGPAAEPAKPKRAARKSGQAGR